MKYFTLSFLIAIFALLMVSCSNSTSTDRSVYVQASLNQGKANFKQKNYELAYRQLLPLAVKGNADAQYAIGYMYYHGEGIDRNEDLAENWLTKAAAKGQPQAIAALKCMHEKNKD